MKRDYTPVLMEELRDQNSKILELLGHIQGLPVQVSHLQSQVDSLAEDIATIRKVVTAQQSDISNLQRHTSSSVHA